MPNCARSPTCSWSATVKRRRRPLRSVCVGAQTWAPCQWPRLWRSCVLNATPGHWSRSVPCRGRPMAARVLMIQGTSSSVGKSLLVTALCRLFARRGVRVAPFKAQNMSNNAAVCADGAEIGRSQAVQAAAAGVAPTADMNPILLKPEGSGRTQVIAMGHHLRTVAAREYGQCKDELWPLVTAALDRLRATYDLVVIEGAGSPAELNLRTRDLANMAVARYAQAPVLLVGDIERGGIFAQLLGTLWLCPPEEQALVRGLIVNKFRGELGFFQEGVGILEERSRLPVCGVIPYLPDLQVPAEDAADLDGQSPA